MHTSTGQGNVFMTKKIKKILLIVILGISTLVIYQNCSQLNEVQSKKLDCNQAEMNGTWTGNVMGSTDYMTIQGCSVSSSYCSSTSTMRMTELNENCPDGSNTCGTGTLHTSSANGNSGCLLQGASVICAFVTFNNGYSLVVNCGNSSITYTR